VLGFEGCSVGVSDRMHFRKVERGERERARGFSVPCRVQVPGREGGVGEGARERSEIKRGIRLLGTLCA
jgi:hypothetical protein